ncbi:MAG TPA: tryptophan 2,3-dioxygenase family protein [Planctomycetota bacterium]|nr:tryptophan 2,3-dioxygenase family protein [Planctomycetota bacterium]
MRPVSYWDYLRLEELLALQGGVERDEKALSNDEVLFVTVHQVYELWFKLILRELRAARNLFMADSVAEQELSGAVRSLERAATIFRVAIAHWDVMETLPTREFLAFRDKLLPASGFQSAQLRQVEILLGLDDSERAHAGLEEGWKKALRGADAAKSPALARVETELADRPTLREAIDEWLYRTPIDGCDPHRQDAGERLAEFLAAFLAAHAQETDATAERAVSIARSPADAQAIRARYEAEKVSVEAFFAPSEAEGGARRARIRAAMLFIETYRELPLLAWPREVLDGLVGLEELFVIFRQRHARMVERVIGRRTGTGGSSGVDYLDATAKYRIFRDLWAIRTLQIRRAAAPALRHPEFYAFRSG